MLGIVTTSDEIVHHLQQPDCTSECGGGKLPSRGCLVALVGSLEGEISILTTGSALIKTQLNL